MLISGNIAYVADKTAGVKIMDISQPGYCNTLSSVEYDYAKDLALTDNNILLLTGGTQMQLININDPSNPDLLSSVRAVANTMKVSYGAAYGHYAYAAHSLGGSIYDIPDPKFPVKVSVFKGAEELTDMLVTNDRIYLANNKRNESNCIDIVDATDITRPFTLGTYKTAGIPRGLAQNEKNIFLANSSSLMVLKRGIVAAVNDTDDPLLPKEFYLSQNYPNPFNPKTTIKFSLPRSENIRIEVFDVLGEKVKTLINKNIKAGEHAITWDGKNTAGKAVASGVYFYRMDGINGSKTKKMILLR